MTSMITRKCVLLVALMGAMLMTGCVKDEPNSNFIHLSAEGFRPASSAAKASVKDDSTYWVAGDKVWINNRNYTALVSGTDAAAQAVQLAPDHIYRAVYPAEVLSSIEGNNVTVNVPRDYTYRESGGKQVLEGLPLVSYYNGSASGTDPDTLKFKHLTAAITIRIKNTKAQTITLDRVELFNSQYQLGGALTVDLSQAGGSGKPVVTPIKRGVKDSIIIHFPDTNYKLATDAYVDIQVPMIPVGSDNSEFTIKVYGHKQGVRHIYQRATGDRDNSIGRACLGYAVAKYASDAYNQTGDLFDQIKIDDKDYYKIRNSEELMNLSAAMDNRWETSMGENHYNYGNYIVVADIDLNGAEFTPIHYYNEDSETECIFDGNHKTVSNFTASSIDEHEPNVCGFFGKTDGSNITIKDLNITNATYEYKHAPNTSGVPYATNPCTAVGGVIGLIDQPNITISGCSTSNLTFSPQNDATTRTDMYVAGIAGYVTEECTISGCSVGAITLDNSNQSTSGQLIDQFGAAIGRIDVGYTTGAGAINFTWADTVGGEIASPNPKRITISDFTYTQGASPMEFSSKLQSVRYGGLIGNITEGGIIDISRVQLHHNVRITAPTNDKECGGLIGWVRSSHDIAIVLNASGCVIDGSFEILGYTGAKADSLARVNVNKYVGTAQTYVESQGDPTCTNNLAFTASSQGESFRDQTLLFNRRSVKVTTTNNTGSITATSITCKGKVEKVKGTYTVTDRGICWASYFTVGGRDVRDSDVTMDNPAATVVSCGSGGYGNFEVPLTGLRSDASHYYKAYATFTKRSASDPTSTISVTILGNLSTRHKTKKS